MSGPGRSRSVRRAEALANRISWRASHRSSILLPEFPRSGGTWIAKLLGAALDVPVPQASRLPIHMPCVLHGHLLPRHSRPGTQRVLVTRDGRDVYLSLLHHMRNLDAGSRAATSAPAVVRTFLRDADAPASIAIGAFLEWQLEDPSYVAVPWHIFNQEWLSETGQHAPIHVRYEDFLADTPAALADLTRRLGETVRPAVARLVAERYDFELLSGRAPGVEQSDAFMRSGIAGGWRDVYDAEAESVFWANCGDVAVQLGYQTG